MRSTVLRPARHTEKHKSWALPKELTAIVKKVFSKRRYKETQTIIEKITQEVLDCAKQNYTKVTMFYSAEPVQISFGRAAWEKL